MATDTQQLEALEADAKYILPVYIAVDHSWSMSPAENNAIDAANSLIPTIIRTCVKNPLADERARFCVIGFNDRARVVSPLARGTNLAQHTFEASSGTSFSEVFRLLRSQLEADYSSLKADGYKVYRPAVFLITDGEPLDDPASAFAELTDPNFDRRPNLSVFGLGHNVPQEVVETYTAGKGRAFLTADGSGASEALGGFIEILMQSIVSSTAKVSSGDASEADDGFKWDDDAIADEDFLLEIES
ncbi:putative von Willebrand factor type A [Nostocoides australiense Ben110]|uniref:Putative von Willebrand factor type A n=1 Tax=Nostocoides australiense Ben110 TaxID=1193182 RepID=W6K3B2_9MICO|nr:putative von Willebrand factor type A [Tetrasphaera australiensis Ben110]